MRMLLLISMLGVGMCGQPRPFDPRIDVPLDEPFPLRVEQSADITGTPLRLHFVAVTEDSRCPADVVCVWAGNARVQLRAERGGDGDSEEVRLNTGLHPRSASVFGYAITLEEVAPGRRTDTPLPAGDYVATLRVTKP